MAKWMIYGATGYTGRLLIEEAVARGHQPVIAGRSALKLRPLAEKYGLDFQAFEVKDKFTIMGNLREAGVDLVLHAAGPFIHTSEPMLKACVESGIHYLDITGEIPVFETTFRYDAQAQDKGVVLMSGVGFDIVPSDCLAKYVADQLPDATSLEVAVSALNAADGELGASVGTVKTMVEMAYMGGYIRRDHQIVPYDFSFPPKTFSFPMGDRSAIAIPWGDVSTAYRTTGIPNITAYMVFTPRQIDIIRRGGYLFHKLLGFAPLRHWLMNQIARRVPDGPSAQHRATARSYLYARAANDAGDTVEAWMDTSEGYAFTQQAAVRAVERVLDGELAGALSPAAAFGVDFVREIGDTRIMDSIR